MKEGWEEKQLGEAFKTVTGSTPAKSNHSFYGDEVPFVKPPELKDTYVENSEDGLSDRGAKAARVAPEGAVLVSCIGNLGKIGLVARPVAFNQQINAIYPDLRIALPRFVFYFVLSSQFRQQLESLAAGTTVSIVNKSRFNSIKIPLPPPPEQKRIVEVLDKAFEGLAVAKANAEANLQNAQELFQSRLTSIFGDAVKKGWGVKPLETLCNVFDDGDWIESKDQAVSGIRLIQTGNVGLGDFKDREDKARYISEATFKRLRCTEIFEGDCLISRLPDPVGRACLIPATGERMITAVDCTIVRPNQKWIDSKFLVYFTQSLAYLRTVTELCTGTTRSRISRKNLGAVEIPVPPLTEQKRIAEALDALKAQTADLENSYREKATSCDQLKQSLLQKAFDGELT